MKPFLILSEYSMDAATVAILLGRNRDVFHVYIPHQKADLKIREVIDEYSGAYSLIVVGLVLSIEQVILLKRHFGKFVYIDNHYRRDTEIEQLRSLVLFIHSTQDTLSGQIETDVKGEDFLRLIHHVRVFHCVKNDRSVVGETLNILFWAKPELFPIYLKDGFQSLSDSMKSEIDREFSSSKKVWEDSVCEYVGDGLLFLFSDDLSSLNIWRAMMQNDIHTIFCAAPTDEPGRYKFSVRSRYLIRAGEIFKNFTDSTDWKKYLVYAGGRLNEGGGLIDLSGVIPMQDFLYEFAEQTLAECLIPF